jgi:hypothetical protein
MAVSCDAWLLWEIVDLDEMEARFDELNEELLVDDLEEVEHLDFSLK